MKCGCGSYSRRRHLINSGDSGAAGSLLEKNLFKTNIKIDSVLILNLSKNYSLISVRWTKEAVLAYLLKVVRRVRRQRLHLLCADEHVVALKTEVGTEDLVTDGTGDPSVLRCHVDVLLLPVSFFFAELHALIAFFSAFACFFVALWAPSICISGMAFKSLR